MDFDRQVRSMVKVFLKRIWIVAALLVLAVVYFKYSGGREYTPPGYSPLFDQVMPKQPTLSDLKAIRASREPLVTNPTEEDIAIMQADIDEFRKRYEANNVCNEWVRIAFKRRYNYYSKYREAIKPLIEELAQAGDMFALSLNSLRTGNTWLAGQEAARRGELNHMASEGWFLATGFNRPRDEVLGERYLKEAAERGSYSGHYMLIAYYYRYKYLDRLCPAAKEAYERYGLEIFSYEIDKATAVIEYIQNNCRVFSDKEYTSEEMKFEYLKDIDTDESRLVQAMVLSNMGRYDEAKAMFEALEGNADQKIRANAQLCLSRMYYYGGGVKKDEALANLYANKAYDNGSFGAFIYDKLGKGDNVQIPMPKQLLLTEYDCVLANCYYQNK
jgi:TPR repeat protein